MPLIIDQIFRFQKILIQHFLYLEKRCCFMPADITQIVWTSTSQGNMLRVINFLNINFVIRGIAVILYPEYGRAKQIIVLNKFNKADSMDFFSATDYLICSMGVYILDKVRESQVTLDFNF